MKLHDGELLTEQEKKERNGNINIRVKKHKRSKKIVEHLDSESTTPSNVTPLEPSSTPEPSTSSKMVVKLPVYKIGEMVQKDAI